MTAETDESILDTPSFAFVGSKEEYQDLKSKSKEQTPKSDNHTIRKLVITAIVGALAIFGASKLLR
jgi:hypothetical protein